MAKKRANQPGYTQKVGANGKKYWAKENNESHSTETMKKPLAQYPILSEDKDRDYHAADISECIEDDLMGQSIVGVEGNSDHYQGTTLVLGNGQKYRMMGYGECSAYADIDVTKFHKNNNIITDVIHDSTVEDDDSWGTTTIHLLSNSEPIADIRLSWNEGTGYYTFGIDLEVIKEE